MDWVSPERFKLRDIFLTKSRSTASRNRPNQMAAESQKPPPLPQAGRPNRLSTLGQVLASHLPDRRRVQQPMGPVETNPPGHATKQFFASRKASIDRAFEVVTHESGSDAERVKNNGKYEGVLQESDISLAAYLTGRSIVHKTIDGEQLRRLREANDSVNETREKLHHGRSNVAEFLAVSQEPCWRMAFMRRQDLSADAGTALAIKMGTGNCGEHASVAFATHGMKLGDAEKMHLVDGGKKLDHTWVQVEGHYDDQIVMDAWAVGPAILAKDGAFGPNRRRRFKPVVMNTVTRPQGEAIGHQVEERLKSLRDDRLMDLAWETFKKDAKDRDLKLSKWHMFAATPVLSGKFKDAVASQEQRALKFQKKHHIPTDYHRLNTEIQAVGVARALGDRIKDAVKVQKAILDEKDDLLQKPKLW